MAEAFFLPRSAPEALAALLRCTQRTGAVLRMSCPLCGSALQSDEFLYCTPNGEIAGCEHCLRKQYLPDAMF